MATFHTPRILLHDCQKLGLVAEICPLEGAEVFDRDLFKSLKFTQLSSVDGGWKKLGTQQFANKMFLLFVQLATKNSRQQQRARPK